MNENSFEDLLKKVKSGEVEIKDASKMLKNMQFEDLGFVKIDHHRKLRQGFPEVIYCEGKTPEQTATIMERLINKNDRVIGTRASKETYRFIKEKLPDVKYNELARMIIYDHSNMSPQDDKYILVLSAGTSDIPIAEEAALTAEIMGHNVKRIYDVGVAGLHRLLSYQDTIMEANVIIVVAGMEGALASVVGGLVNKPVIAVPTSIGYGANFGGLAALLSMLNSCAAGVAVVNIDNGFGAGRLASIINNLR